MDVWGFWHVLNIAYFAMLPRDEIVLNVWPQKTGGNGNVILQGGAPSAPPVMFHLSTVSSTLLFMKFSKLTVRFGVAPIVDGSNFTTTNTRPCARKQLIQGIISTSTGCTDFGLAMVSKSAAWIRDGNPQHRADRSCQAEPDVSLSAESDLPRPKMPRQRLRA